MIHTRLDALAAVTGGVVSDGDPATLVSAPASVDSRDVAPGGLFVAVPGERVDGHDFAAHAVASGAAAVLAARPLGVPAVVVDNPVAALGRVGRYVVDSLGVAVVGVTGSQGKTSTKDLLAVVLALAGPVVAPRGSLNNELGVPLTATRADRSTLHLVVEMGARGAGHIRDLCQITPPQIGLVLNVGLAHLGEFGSREAIGNAKGELVEALPPEGVAVLNADDPLVARMRSRTRARALSFGQDPAADVRLGNVGLDDRGRARFTLTHAGRQVAVELRLLGEHQAINAAAAAAVALARGLDLADIAAGLSTAVPASAWRMEPHERADGVLVLNDTYNANPDSMRAALKTLVGVARSRGSGRTVAVLGSMRELGATSAGEHDAIGRLAAQLSVSLLVVVGEDARPLHQGACHEGSWQGESLLVADAAAASQLLAEQVQPGDVVLVKASRSEGLERVADALLAAPGDTAAGSPAGGRDDEGVHVR